MHRHLPPRAELKSFWDQAEDARICPKRCEPDCKCDHCTALAELRKHEASARIERNLTRPARRLRIVNR